MDEFKTDEQDQRQKWQEKLPLEGNQELKIGDVVEFSKLHKEDFPRTKQRKLVIVGEDKLSQPKHRIYKVHYQTKKKIWRQCSYWSGYLKFIGVVRTIPKTGNKSNFPQIFKE